MSSQPHYIKGAKLDCKQAIPKELIETFPTQQKHNNFNKIFVGGLPNNVNKFVLQNFFSQYGEVEYCIVMTEKTTEKPRGISKFFLFF